MAVSKQVKMDYAKAMYQGDFTEKIDHAFLTEQAKFRADIAISECDVNSPGSVLRLKNAVDAFEAMLIYKSKKNPIYSAYKERVNKRFPTSFDVRKMIVKNIRSRSEIYDYLVDKFARLVDLQKDTTTFGYQLIPDYIFPNRKYESLVINELNKNVYEQRINQIILVVGKPGTAKSMISIGIAKNFDPTFSIKERIAHKTGESFVRIVDRLMSGGGNKGKAIVWDDAGKGLKSTEWFTFINKAVHDILQSFRVEGWLIIINCPARQDLTKYLASYIDYLVFTNRNNIDFKNRFAWAEIFAYNRSEKTGKQYTQRIRYKPNRYEAAMQIVDKFAVKKILDSEEKLYLEDKIKTNSVLVKDALFTMDEKVEKDDNGKLDLNQIYEEIVSNIDKYIKEYKKRKFIDRNLIQFDYDLSRRNAEKVKAKIEYHHKDKFK